QRRQRASRWRSYRSWQNSWPGFRNPIRAFVRPSEFRKPSPNLIATHLQLHLADHENNTVARSWKALRKCFMLTDMIKLPVEVPTATLRYALAPDEAGIAAIEATFAAYDRMMAILAEVAPVGANLVTLHAQAYERIRTETGLPARLVTLGLRDRAGYIAGLVPRRIPLDDKLF